MAKLKYIITGTGRCGTVYSARHLTSLGIPCGHESFFTYKGIEHALDRIEGRCRPDISFASTMKWSQQESKWFDDNDWHENLENLVADSSYMAAPYLDHEILDESIKIHIVRNPIKVINSFVNCIKYFQSETPSNEYEEMIYSFDPDLRINMPAYDRCALYYIHWNQMISQKQPHFFYRIEDDPSKLNEFLNVAGDGCTDTTVNSYKDFSDKNFNINDIESKCIINELLELCKQYNYNCSELLF